LGEGGAVTVFALGKYAPLLPQTPSLPDFKRLFLFEFILKRNPPAKAISNSFRERVSVYE
jgi:hypothetical protein